MPSVRLLVAEDNTFWVDTVALMLADQDVDIVEASPMNYAELLGALADGVDAPEVALIDLGLPGICRLLTISRCRLSLDEIVPPMIAWSRALDEVDGIWMLCDGARAAIDKEELSPGPLSQLIQLVAGGTAWLSPRQAQWILDRVEYLETSLESKELALAAAFGLTDLERATLVDIAEGLPVHRERSTHVNAIVRPERLGEIFMSDRVREAVAVAASFRTNGDAADRLGIAIGTYSTHLREAGDIMFPSAAIAARQLELEGQPPDPNRNQAGRVRAWAMIHHHEACELPIDKHKFAPAAKGGPKGKAKGKAKG